MYRNVGVRVGVFKVPGVGVGAKVSRLQALFWMYISKLVYLHTETRGHHSIGVVQPLEGTWYPEKDG